MKNTEKTIRNQFNKGCVSYQLCLNLLATTDLTRWQMDIKEQKAKCPYEEVTRRSSMNKVFHTLEEMNPEARYSLWKAMSNIKEEYLTSK